MGPQHSSQLYTTQTRWSAPIESLRYYGNHQVAHHRHENLDSTFLQLGRHLRQLPYQYDRALTRFSTNHFRVNRWGLGKVDEEDLQMSSKLFQPSQRIISTLKRVRRPH